MLPSFLKLIQFLRYNSHTIIKFTLAKCIIQQFLVSSQDQTTNHHYLIPEHFSYPRKKPYTQQHSPPLPQPLATTNWFFASTDRREMESHHIGPLMCLPISLTVMFSKLTHVTARSSASRCFYGRVLFSCIDTPCFAYPFISWQIFYCFPLLAIMNNTAMHISIHAFVWKCLFFLDICLGNGYVICLAQSYDNSF